MNNRLFRYACLQIVLGIGISACGGAAQTSRSEEIAAEPAPLSSASKEEIVLTRADLTVATDASGLEAAAPTSVEFLPDTPAVYLVATLKNLPKEADIEVRWTESTMGPPIFVTHESGAGTYAFSSKFDLAKFAAEKALRGEKIQVQVFVNGAKIGGAAFTVSDRRSGGVLKVKGLAVSGAVETETYRPIKSSGSFRKGTKKVFASFYVGGLEPGASILVRWLHEDETVKEEDLASEGEKRYAVSIQNPRGLAFGDWTVEVEILGDVFAARSFFMGDESSGTAVEEAALGTAIGKNKMPKKAKTSFKSKPGTIHCGIRFLYAPAGSNIEIRWVSMTQGSGDILQTTAAKVKNEGPAAMNMAWRPGKALPAGPYKAVILADGVVLQELPFEIK